MIARIQSIHFDADSKLLIYLNEKLESLEHYVSREIEAKVMLRLEKVGHIQDKIVEILINLPGHPLVAKSTGKTFEQAILDAIEHIKTQLIRYKEKIQRKTKK